MTAPLNISFLKGAIAHRAAYGGGKNQLLGKACGTHKHKGLTVLDTTAGLGRDAFILATLGCHVTLLERHDNVYNALKMGILEAREAHIDAAQRMNVIHTNSIDYLKALTDKPQVIYIDPMYPHSKKTALVKKDMRDLRDIVGDDTDSEQLLHAALGKASYRVTVKRPRLAPVLGERTASFSYDGKSSRFDIYLP
jgi:16S rRNA (guanine1516-N2)-methyltransferase